MPKHGVFCKFAHFVPTKDKKRPQNPRNYGVLAVFSQPEMVCIRTPPNTYFSHFTRVSVICKAPKDP